MEMIRTVLDNNVFGFGDKSYIQKEGIAIGSRLGKNFACAYMRKWDEALLRFRASPYFYKRFIDDGFGIWTEGEDELKLFAKHANSIHPNIQVELRYDRKQIEFLDTLGKLEDGHIYIRTCMLNPLTSSYTCKALLATHQTQREVLLMDWGCA